MKSIVDKTQISYKEIAISTYSIFIYKYRNRIECNIPRKDQKYTITSSKYQNN